jgi:type IV pilus assembly protein PilM
VNAGNSILKKEIRLRRPSMPKLSAPKVSVTKIDAPTSPATSASAPRMRMPKLSRLSLSKLSAPKISAPKLSSSKLSLKKVSLPAAHKPSLGHKVDRVVGLKIGGSQISAACIANNGSAKLEQIARTPLARGIISGGELRDIPALADALRTFFEQNELPRKGVRLGIASSRIGVRSIELPAIDNEEQFLNAVRFRAQEALPIPLDEAMLDYRVLGDRVAEGGQRLRRVLLVVAHRELVERYIEACRLAGVTLSGIDLEAFALLRAIAQPADREQSALVAVSLGYDRTTLAVSDGRVCEFARMLEWGGKDLDTGIGRALEMDADDVAPLKAGLSLDGGDAPDGLTSEQAAKAVDALHRGIESLVRELVSSLTYYQSQPGSLAIGEIVLTGGSANLSGLPEELARQLGVPVRLGDPFGRLEVDQLVDQTEMASLAIAVGLGIED